MPTHPMTDASRAFFEACTPKTKSSPMTAGVYAGLLGIHEVRASVATRLAELRLLLAKANAAEEDAGIYGKFARFEQTLGAMEREAAALAQAAEHLADACFQLDQYGAGVWSELAVKPAETPAA